MGLSQVSFGPKELDGKWIIPLSCYDNYQLAHTIAPSRTKDLFYQTDGLDWISELVKRVRDYSV